MKMEGLARRSRPWLRLGIPSGVAIRWSSSADVVAKPAPAASQRKSKRQGAGHEHLVRHAARAWVDIGPRLPRKGEHEQDGDSEDGNQTHLRT